jgi:hypothetical protein
MKVIMPGASAFGFKFQAETVDDDGTVVDIIETNSLWDLIKFFATNIFK